MKRLFIVGLFLLFCSQLMAIDYFKGSYQEALEKGRLENKRILLFFTASWCGPCQGMKNYVLTNAYIERYIDSNYIALMLDYDLPEVRELYARYSEDKGSVPRFIIINDKEEVFDVLKGATNVARFKEFIRFEEGKEPIGRIAANPNKYYQDRRPSKLDKVFYNLMVSRVKPGVRIGMNFNGLHTSPDDLYSDFRTGYVFGISAKYWMTRNMSLTPELVFTSKGAKNNSLDQTFRLNYVELPVVLGVKVWRRYSINVAPYGAVAVSGCFKHGDEKQSISFGEKQEQIDRFDYGIKAALNMMVGSFEWALGYSLGLHNISNHTDSKMYNRGVYLTIGMNLGM